MDIKLIAMDLDGTALQNDHNTFSPRLNAALEKAHEKGIAIAPVTGRQFGLLPPPLKQHPLWEDLVVLCNGGQVRRLKTGEVLHSLVIAPAALKQLIALAERFDLPLEFSVDSTLYLTEASYRQQLPYPNLTFHRDTILANHGKIVASLDSLCNRPVEKVNLLCISPDIREEVEQALENIAVSAVWASSTSMEITHPEATKSRGLEALCRLLDIPMEQVMALGDSGNDITMLRKAGLGVAMGNAPDYVKAAARVVTADNTMDGAAIAIEKYVLNTKEK